MTDIQSKLIAELRNIFQFDQADLDFGIYRIMAMRREEINNYLEMELITQIQEGLEELASLDNRSDIAAIDKDIERTKTSSLSDTLKAATLEELHQKRIVLTDSIDISGVEHDVYNHLYEFFSRYYNEGDFISQRRYKDGVYAIPYEGEEVKLHWANSDQYYVKTSEYFKDYAFKGEHGQVCRFKLTNAETERDNNKAKEKRLFQLRENAPFLLDGDALTVFLEFKSGDKKQDAYIGEILSSLKDAGESLSGASWLLETHDGKTLLERELIRYTAKNTFDYFIHKDLSGFLYRELDFFIKNEVFYIDDVDEQSFAHTRAYITKAKVIRRIARKIIEFLAQIENFQKKLFLKIKFVVETNYCITIDRVPEELYAEVIENDAQRDEWVRLFAIDEMNDNPNKPAYSNPLTIEFLQANPFLVLDTKLFDVGFKEKLIASIDNLDENLDGLLIHSENFQALGMLHQTYAGKVNYCYIDPPYNSDSAPIPYKNGYKDSSWLSLIDDRILRSKKLIASKGVYTIAIDDTEVSKLLLLLSQRFSDHRISNVIIVHNPKGSPTKDFNRTHEYAIYVTEENVKDCIARILEENDTPRKMRRWGENSKRTERRLSFYPIYIKNGRIIRVGEVPDDSYHPSGKNEVQSDGSIAIWPIDQNNVERRWNFGLDTIRNNIDRITIIEDEGVYDLFLTHELTIPKTVWKGGEFDAGSYGNTLLKNMLGEKLFDFPKSINTVMRCIQIATESNDKALILDYFAGSGTTAHAVINLNRRPDDDGKRKYILVEMGEYFDTVTKPRVQKVVYSDKWAVGKPASNGKGSSHAFKYLRLESYEDALGNISMPKTTAVPSHFKEEYLLRYMLDAEAEGQSLLPLDSLVRPFEYQLMVTRNYESIATVVDLPETFNYLIGLTAKRSHAKVSFSAVFTEGQYGALSATLAEGDTYTFKAVEGTLPNGDTALIIWRTLTAEINNDNAVLEAYYAKFDNHKKVYINGDCHIEGALLIEDVMKKRMFVEV